MSIAGHSQTFAPNPNRKLQKIDTTKVRCLECRDLFTLVLRGYYPLLRWVIVGNALSHLLLIGETYLCKERNLSSYI